MSYDLSLYRKTGSPLTVEEIRSVFENISNIEQGDEQFIYRLPDSEACFFFDVESEEYGHEDDIYDFPEGTVVRGRVISVHIPYGFSDELMPVYPKVVARVARELKLRIYDGQADEEVSPRAFERQEYWQVNAVHEPPDISSFKRLKLSDSAKRYIVRYAAAMQELRDLYRDTPIRVPEIVLIATLSYDIHTAIVWNDFEPIVLPKVDAVVYVARKCGIAGLLGKKSRWVTVVDGCFEISFQNALQKVRNPIPHHVIRVDQHPDIMARQKYRPDDDLPGWHYLGPMPPVDEG